MLILDVNGIALAKRRLATEPFIDHDPKSILIAGLLRFASALLGSHIIGCSSCVIGTSERGPSSPREHGNPKVAQSQFSLPTNQHIVRLDVAMDHVLAMGILQCLGNLLYILHHCGEWHLRSLWMTSAQ